MATANVIVAGATGQNWNLSWSLQGALTIPAGNTYTDGYNLKYQATVVTTATAVQFKNVCVQYLDSAGAALVATDTAQGAPFVCIQAEVAAGAAAGNQTSIKVKTMSHAELGCHAALTPACTGFQNGGTVLPTGTAEVWDSDGVGVVSVVLAAAKVRHVTWWQPKESSDYASLLRRYSKDTKVKGHNLALQPSGPVGSTLVTYTMFTSGAAVTLAGAASLAAGVALGAAALAF